MTRSASLKKHEARVQRKIGSFVTSEERLKTSVKKKKLLTHSSKFTSSRKMLALRKLLHKPKLEDGNLYSLFYYCDIAVNCQMEELNHLMRSNPDNLDRRAVLIRQLKEAQHNLMNIIMSITSHAIPQNRASRDFRAKYPDDVLLDQINGPIWFGAECIAAGSHIANHELESAELRPYAIQVSKMVTKVRQALREECFTNKTGAYPQKIKDLLQTFDELWADFEFRYVGLMCNVKSEEQYYHQQDVVVLFCESTLRAIRLEYLTEDMIEMMDPSVMFAIPRLAIFCGLVVYPDGPINPARPHKEMPPCFRAYRQLLARIKELLAHLNKEQLITLEQALCSAEGLSTLERNKNKAAAAARKKHDAQQRQQSLLPPPTNNSSTSTSLSASSSDSSNSDLPPALPPRSPTRSQSPSNGNSQTLTVPVEHHHVHHQRPNSAALALSPTRSGTGAVSPVAVSPTNGQQLPRSRSYDLDSRDNSSTVFEPIPRPISVQRGQGSVSINSGGVVSTVNGGGAEGRDGAVVTIEEPEFPRLGVDQPVVNELPSRRERGGGAQSTNQQDANHDGTITSSSSPATNNTLGAGTATTSSTVSLSLSPAKKVGSGSSPSKHRRTKYKGPAGFPSAEDLMHRLFLGISGVADQLQSNHAKELRVILKHVFTVCQSEPDMPLSAVLCGSGSGAGYEENNSLEPCTPEPQSPLIADSQRFSFATVTLASEHQPNWVPDADSPSCSNCKERFSWKKRRHHCRSCGNVVCARCSPNNLPLPQFGINKAVRVCSNCYIKQLGHISSLVITPHSLQVQ